MIDTQRIQEVAEAYLVGIMKDQRDNVITATHCPLI